MDEPRHTDRTTGEQPEPATPEERLVEELSRPPEDRGALRRYGGLVFGIVLLAGLISAVLHFADMRVFADTLKTADPGWLAAALGFQGLTYGCAALVWQRALKRTGAHVPFRNLLGLALVELFANQAVPTGGLSGSIMVVRGLTRRGIAAPVGITALLVAALSYYAGYVLCALAAFLLLWRMGDFSDGIAGVMLAFLGVVALLAGTMLWLMRSRGRFIPEFALRWRPMARLAAVLAQVRMDILQNRRVLVETTLLQALVFVLDAATLWAALRAVGLPLAPASAFISFVFASVIGTLSPVPMGLGTFEGTATGMLHFLGGSVEASLAATLILRGFTLWLPMLPGLWMMRSEARRAGRR